MFRGFCLLLCTASGRGTRLPRADGGRVPALRAHVQSLCNLSMPSISSILARCVAPVIVALLSSLLPLSAQQHVRVFDPYIKTIQVVANDDTYAPTVIRLGSDERVELSFDQLSHQYHRYKYILTHCNSDWSPSNLPESDYMDGFNDNVIEEYATSLNTTMLYTHYSLTLPNDEVSLKLSGNYLVTVYDDDEGDPTRPVFEAGFCVLEPRVSVSATVSTNTEIDNNRSHQQVSFSISHGGYTIRNPQTEVKAYVYQNNREDNRVGNLRPSFIGTDRLAYEHNHSLIFPAGNEYRRFEMVNNNSVAMGIEDVSYLDPYYHATLAFDGFRTNNYLYDQDQNGRFVVRYDEALEQEVEADYYFVHFTLDGSQPLPGDFYLQGAFTYDALDESTRLTYDPGRQVYECVQLLKQGAYNYQYLYVPSGGNWAYTATAEGDFYQTENEYLILVYHRPFGGRYDKLVGMQRVKING